MIVSMTGFALETVASTRPTGEPLTFTIMLKSLNGRFFEATCKMPFVLTHLETECIKRLKAALIRGTVYLTISTSTPAALKTSAIPALSVVDGYVNALTIIQQRFSLPGMITINDIALLPNIFETAEELADDTLSAQILEAVDRAAQQLTKLRVQEGAELAIDIHSQLAELMRRAQELKERATVLATERHQALADQAAALLNLHQSDFKEQQLAILQAQLDKYDVHEEIVRFTAHLGTLGDILKNPEIEKGKRIDFTVQELFREVNTMASKSNDAQMSTLAIASKVALEKIREQAQNLV